MTTTPDPGDAPDPNESPSPTGPTPPAPPPYAPGDPAAYPPPGPVGYSPPPSGPMGYTPPPPMPQRKTNWLGIIVLVGIVAVLGIGFWLFRDRLSGDVGDLAVGDCFDEPAVMTEVSDVQHQPCNGPHDGEVFLVVTDPASGAYPERQHFRDLATQQCVPAASAYLATDFNARLDIDYSIFFPLEEGWDDGDRELTCYFVRVGGGQLNGSVKNIGSAPLP
jgi:hypothetical protein